MPKFSVVISVFNKEKYIAKTLQSVLDQTFQDFEIVILNDGSTDASEKEILRFKDDRIRYYSEKNQGAAAGRNFVIKKATGEFIALLDADDYWYSNHLQLLSNSSNQYPEETVFANALEISERNTVHPAPYSLDYKDGEITIHNYFEASMMSSILHSSNFAVKSAVFEEVGLYNEKYITGEDTDFYVRLGLKFEVVFNPEITVRFFRKEEGLDFSNRTILGKATFMEYEEQEQSSLPLKKFLDLNRYSLCLTAKLEGNNNAFKEILSKTNLDNLNSKQRFLLQQPVWMLKGAKQIKVRLERLGLRVSSFG